MRIGIDVRELRGNPTGVGRHVAGLLDGWRQDPSAASHTWLLYTPGPVDTALPAEVRIVPGDGGTLWEQIDLPRAARNDRLDVFFAPGYTAPIAWTTPTVVLVHDISFASHPEWFRWKEGLRRRAVTRWSSSRARLVLTVSEAVRREIMSSYSLPANRVRCIYPGVATLTAPIDATTATQPREPLVLFVGSVFNRRHLPDLIRAFRPIAQQHRAARLEIVGDNRSFPYEDLPAVAQTEGIAGQVVIRSYLGDRELAATYERARAFALLSEYEGFGHPPLEALRLGVPSVLFETEVAREVCADAALFVPVGDVAGVTAALTRLLFDETTRARVLEAGTRVLSRYSWPRAAAETLSALETAAGA
jgi:glycosyltransferase involved in cell wall biosynthesis